MKHTLIALLVTNMFFGLPVQAQIPNASFESWNGNTPAGWTTNNNSSTVTVTKVTDAHEGSFALKGTVVAGPTTVAVPPLVQSMSGNYGFPVDASFTSFSCWYKTFLLMSDRFNVNVFVYDASFAVVGGGSASLNTSESAYTPLTVPVFHFAPGAAWAMISFTIVDGTTQTPGHIMSWFQVDELSSQSQSTGFEGPSETSLSWGITAGSSFSQLFLNAPVTDHLNISISDLAGRTVYSIKLEVTAPGEHIVNINQDHLPPGIYLVTVNDSRQRVISERIAKQ